METLFTVILEYSSLILKTNHHDVNMFIVFDSVLKMHLKLSHA